MSWRSHGRYVAGVGAIAFLLWFPYVRSTRVPLLWAADLGFHELGHLLAVPLGETAHFLAGSTTQVLVPVGLACYFWLRLRDPLATGLMLAWAATAAQDVSVYVADAPYERLPLIGGHHDWAFLLGRWGVIDAAPSIARSVWVVGLLAGLGGLILCAVPLATPLVARKRSRSATPQAGDLPVRPARFRD